MAGLINKDADFEDKLEPRLSRSPASAGDKIRVGHALLSTMAFPGDEPGS